MVQDTLAEAVGRLLRVAPERWADVPVEDSTDEELVAIRKLTQAGFIEQRVTVKIQIPGIDVAYRITFEATGESGGEYALRAVKQDWLARWGEHLRSLSKEFGRPAQLIVIPERIQWRITDQGRLAKADLENGEQIPIDFALKRGFFDGEPRLLPDGQLTWRKPVRGHGHLVSIESVQDKPLAVEVVKFSAASELAQAFAKEFEGVIKASLAEIKGVAETGRGEGQPSSGGEKPQAEFVFARDGDGWFIRGFGKQGHFKNMKGLEYIPKLLACPGKPVPMVELIGSGDANATASLRAVATADVPQPVLDDDARHSIRRRLEELAADIARAEENHEYTEADVLRNEFQRLSEHVKATTTPRGKTARFPSPTDKMRWRITKALRRAYKALRKGKMHDLAAHLETYIKAEGDCVAYLPSSVPPWAL